MTTVITLPETSLKDNEARSLRLSMAIGKPAKPTLPKAPWDKEVQS